MRGYLNGKAVVYIPNGPNKIDPSYSLEIKGHIDKAFTTAFTYTQFSVVYEPKTADNGYLLIEVDAP
ncbi:hypothetical protein [Spirosoma validum]|uniref:Uncharacterized protein n=1 Tax=Spirosoma validum TaxID=2771355 RepID=A0A927B2L5_9BACT|nr:hypothetical protein [Spirosoma validum]MBD2754429.1 hypothetical protein [Spirosoma validum]